MIKTLALKVVFLTKSYFLMQNIYELKQLRHNNEAFRFSFHVLPCWPLFHEGLLGRPQVQYLIVGKSYYSRDWILQYLLSAANIL